MYCTTKKHLIRIKTMSLANFGNIKCKKRNKTLAPDVLHKKISTISNFPPEMFYAMLLWVRLISTIHVHCLS